MIRGKSAEEVSKAEAHRWMDIACSHCRTPLSKKCQKDAIRGTSKAMRLAHLSCALSKEVVEGNV